jgi:hypothetical protein
MSGKYQVAYSQQISQEIKQTPEEYLPMLLEVVRLFRQTVTLKSAEDSFRQGWQEAVRGETMPISDLWVGIDDK